MAIPRYEHPGYNGEHIPSPAGAGINSLVHHLLAEFPGSKNLGITNNRSIRGGTSKSLHAVSRAVDWGYENRKDAEAVMDALTQNNNALATVLGVQSIHDYHVRQNNGAHWGKHPAPGHTWGHGRGWHYGSIGPGDKWLHIELHIDSAHDGGLMDRVLVSGLPTHAPDVHQNPEPHHDIDAHHEHDERHHDMIVLDLNPDTPAWVSMLCTGDRLMHIVNGNHVNVLLRSGVHREKVTDEELDGILKSVKTTNASPFGSGPSKNDHLNGLWVTAA